MNFKKTNIITGWTVCLIACTVYIMTSEAGGSLWDCGEFVSSCFKVQIPHPPGAPFFVLLGRIFIVLFGDNPMTAAKGVNVMSALASGFTILFLFWTITHFARKIVNGDASIALTPQQIWSIMGAGIVGALAYTFCDSFWYSAVEGEVYAMSSFFTAIVFWAILKWENVADEPGADRWIIFIFFMIGLSIGVHLLCLLSIPAIVMAYYFKKRETFNYKKLRKYFIWIIVIGGALAFIMSVLKASGDKDALLTSQYVDQLRQAFGNDVSFSDSTVSGLMVFGTFAVIGLLYLIERINKAKKEYYGGAFMFFIIGVLVLGVVQVGVIQYSIKAAGYFDIFFVNNIGLPFFSGFVVFFLLVAIAMWFALRFAAKKGWSLMRLAIWSIAFTLIGYSTYVTTMIRSNSDPAIDMYNVDNPQSLVGYLARDQYGDFPILYGQKFNAPGITYKETSTIYQKGKDKYEEMGKNGYVVYLPKDKMIFPRMWDASNDQGHADYYANFMGVGKSQDGSYDIDKDPQGFYTRPNFTDNVKFFISYQVYFMYFRYFMWNFSGKQNDIEGTFTGNVRDGNWITGIPIVDNALYGDQSLMPDSMKNNKAHNTLFMLPLILGVIGLFYQFKKRGDDGLVNMLLFFFTGFAIVIYLNQPGFQPRERDYAYAGSFYAFAVWIGLAVPYFIEMAVNWKNQQLLKSMLYSGGGIALFFVAGGFISSFVATGSAAGGISFGIAFALLYSLLAGGVPFILKYIGNKTTLTYAAIIISVAVPLWMGAQEWDDHDRSRKEMARDLAKDYLESCAPNAILFTFGDNDTYPLWYAQEVEGIRPDIRVINTSLLGIDWYINQLRYKINKSDSIDVIWTPDQIQGSKRNIVYFQANTQFPDNNYYDLYSLMHDYVGSDKPDRMTGRGGADDYNTFPSHKVSVPVDISLVRKNGTVNADDSVVSQVNFQIPTNSLQKNDLAILNVIAANKWKRPIYFTMAYNSLGFQNYLRRDGLSYRLVPVENSQVNTDWMLNLVMDNKRYAYGNANLPGVYFDEENRRHLNDIRDADVQLALDLVFKNRKEDAKKVLERSDKMMLQENFPYGLVSRGNDHNRSSLLFLQACYRAGDTQLAAKVLKSVKTDLQQQMKYYNSLNDQRAQDMSYEKSIAQDMLSNLDQIEKLFNPSAQTAPAENGNVIGNDSPLKLQPVDTTKK